MSNEMDRRGMPPRPFFYPRTPDQGRDRTNDPAAKVKNRNPPYNVSHPDDAVRDEYETKYQKDYYSERPLNYNDRNYAERTMFEERVQSTLGFSVNMVALKILALETEEYQQIVTVIMDKVSKFLDMTSLNEADDYQESVKKLCDQIVVQNLYDQITKNFKTLKNHQKIWLIQWIKAKLKQVIASKTK